MAQIPGSIDILDSVKTGHDTTGTDQALLAKIAAIRAMKPKPRREILEVCAELQAMVEARMRADSTAHVQHELLSLMDLG